jgi:hypothetical protein
MCIPFGHARALERKEKDALLGLAKQLHSAAQKSVHNLGHFINGSRNIWTEPPTVLSQSTAPLLSVRALRRCKSVREEGQKDADAHDSCCIIIRGEYKLGWFQRGGATTRSVAAACGLILARVADVVPPVLEPVGYS